MIKVAFLNPTIPPRVISLLNKISQDKKITIKGFFFAVSQKNRSWSLDSNEYEKITFPFQIFKSISFGVGFKDYHNSFISFNVWQELSDYNPDIVVLPGWADITSYISLVWAKYNHKKIILRSESTIYEKSMRRIIFSPLTKIVCENVNLIIGSSKRASEYSKLIAPKTKNTTILSSFDTVKFNQQIDKSRKNKQSIKKSLGITQKKVFYFNGQTIERKGIIPLLSVFSKMKNKDCALILTGKGQLDDFIAKMARKYKNIYHFGYQTQDKLVSYYSIADFFILPSYEETWGLVTVEALAAALPVIISSKAGSSELINNNTHGFLLSDIGEFSIKEAIKKALMLSNTDYSIMSKKCKSLALKELNYNRIARQFNTEFKRLVS